jgi:hypothetical protein
MALSVAVQWLFGKCPKRSHQAAPEAKVKMIKTHEEESSDEFELISNNEEEEEEPQVEDEQKKREEAENDQKAH